ncbi:hypothetical protein UC34_19525 [Pandoraea vervacti]|uniref:Pili assembly chaperone N-terminal domain-containing protein n=1 Tax=Pandoraea vervacti TaxID=656178 RepID=A0ABN4U9L1_9BURK|nr:fimbrial protein TcfA [Pandoraea vervacti]APD11385.1 hypothetical protein UC34_19525 [Pandoraea vervacti]
MSDVNPRVTRDRKIIPAWRHAIVAGALAWAPALASANVSISPIASVIAGDQPPVSVIRITSQSPHAQYVDVSVRRIVDPATDAEHEVSVEFAPHGQPQASGGLGNALVASPAKFVLAAGATRLVRVVALGRPQTEVAYRVYFRPVIAPVQGQPKDAQDAISPDVNVNFVWGALVRVEPQRALPGLARTPIGDADRLKNTGNVRAHVTSMGRCDGDAEHACEWHEIGRSVYPGLTYPIPEALRNLPVRVRYRVDGAVDEQVVDLTPTPAASSADIQGPQSPPQSESAGDHAFLNPHIQ